MPSRAHPPDLRSEHGFGLIEVMVSALLVVVVAIAALGAIEAASRGSARTKSRSIAASLAQQDQERLQQIAASALANLDQTRSLPHDGVTYSVRSQGQYIGDVGQVPECGTSRGDYVRTTTTVTWPQMSGAKPIRLVSTVRPPAGSFSASEGSIALNVTNAAAVGLDGLGVDLTDGPVSMRRETEDGCVFFAYLPVGNYKLRYSLPGWVDRSGVRDVVIDATAISEQTTSYTGEYDRAGNIYADVVTRARRGGTATELTSKADALRITHASLAGGQRIAAAVPAATRIAVTSLFPFTSAYGLHTGSCSVNALPAALATSARSSGYVTDQLVAPGITYGRLNPTDPLLEAFQPALDPRVRVNAVGVSGATLHFYPVTAGCTGPRITRTTTTGGYLAATDLGLPYGTYNVCAWANVSGTSRQAQMPAQVTDQLDGRAFDVNISGTSSTTACPA